VHVTSSTNSRTGSRSLIKTGHDSTSIVKVRQKNLGTTKTERRNKVLIETRRKKNRSTSDKKVKLGDLVESRSERSEAGDVGVVPNEDYIIDDVGDDDDQDYISDDEQGPNRIPSKESVDESCPALYGLTKIGTDCIADTSTELGAFVSSNEDAIIGWLDRLTQPHLLTMSHPDHGQNTPFDEYVTKLPQIGTFLTDCHQVTMQGDTLASSCSVVDLEPEEIAVANDPEVKSHVMKSVAWLVMHKVHTDHDDVDESNEQEVEVDTTMDGVLTVKATYLGEMNKWVGLELKVPPVQHHV